MKMFGKSPAKTVFELLKENGLTLSTAESCTGGLLADSLVQIPGSSEVFGYGAVTYANEAKIKLLGVKEETLSKYGAVSEQTAKEMAEGIKKLSGSDIGAATTGIAGPGGGTPEKPVGLVYIAVSGKNGTKVRRLNLSGSRAHVRKLAVKNILNMITIRNLNNSFFRYCFSTFQFIFNSFNNLFHNWCFLFKMYPMI